MTREQTYTLSNRRDQINFIYHLAVYLREKGNRGLYYFEHFDDYHTPSYEFERLSNNHLVGVKATAFNGILMLLLLQMIYVYRFYSTTRNNEYSFDRAINHLFGYIFDVNDFPPNLTFLDNIDTMINIVDDNLFTSYRTLADVKHFTPNNEKPIIWTGNDIFNAINEMMSQR